MENYNGQSQYPLYHQGAPSYAQQFQQYEAPEYRRPPASQPHPQSRIEVAIPSRNPPPLYQPPPQLEQLYQPPSSQDPFYYPPPLQQFYQPLAPQYYRAPPPPVPIYDHHFAPQPSPRNYPPEREPHMNGHASMNYIPSSPDPLQNSYEQPPGPRQAVQQPPPQPAPEPEPDYAILLLSLAEEYFEAAKKLRSRSGEYYQLIATALGCLESVLTNFNLEPLREAQISLQYAQTLFDETENYDDAEKTLTKAIDICERNTFLDLKYSLQLLLACVLFQSKPKAAIKDLQSLIEDTKDYKHVAWGYALRYQLVAFYQSNTNIRDTQQAIQHLEKLGDSAQRNGDKAIVAFAAIVEAMFYLGTSHQDAVISAQRALATARSVLGDPVVTSVPQLPFMAEVVDLCCSIRESDVAQGNEKRKRMQTLFGAALDDKVWKNEGPIISCPISQTSLRGLALQKGGLVQDCRGRHVLRFSWLDLEEAELVGFLLSVMSRARKNASDRDKVQTFLDEGLKGTRELLRKGFQRTAPEHSEKMSQPRLLECHFLVEQAFLQCSPGNWDAARETLQAITKSLNSFEDSAPMSLKCVVKYLQGVVEQGTGNLDAALTIYRGADLDLTHFQRTTVNGAPAQPTVSRSNADFETRRNISILAAMNTLLIINDPSHPSHPLRASLLDQLSSLIKSCYDKNILAAYTLVHQQVTERGMVVSKNQLVSALNAAKAVANTQITALVLMVMQQNFFRGQTDEHANKCVRAAAVNVRQWGDPTWSYVAAGIETESLEFRGERMEAERMKEDIARRLEMVPEKVRRDILAGKR